MKILCLVLCILATVFGDSEPQPKEIDFSNVRVYANSIIRQPAVIVVDNKTEPDRKVSGRIINGKIATTITKFPYQVKLFLKSATESTDEEDVFSSCGGSIISPYWILTAAHCLKDALQGYMYVGCVNWKKLNDGHCRKIWLTTRNYIWHDDFYSNEQDTQNDIGLIRLRRPLKFSSSVNRIQLNTYSNVKPDTPVVLSGYGITETGALSDRLKYTTVKIIDEKLCKVVFPNVNPSMICFGASSITSDCQGDSGGPMTMSKKGKILLVGVTSFGGPTCLNYPGVYTRVSAFLNWICAITGICEIEDWES